MGICCTRHTHHKGGSVHSAPPGQPFISRPLAPGLLPPFALPQNLPPGHRHLQPPSAAPQTARHLSSRITAARPTPMPSGASWSLASWGGRGAGNLWGVVTGPHPAQHGGSISVVPDTEQRVLGFVSLFPSHELWGVPVQPQQQQTWGVGWGSFFAPRTLRRRQPVASRHAAFFRSRQQ